MRFNVAFGIMLGLALVELLLLQVAVLVDGHVITPPPALPTAMTGAGNPILAKRENTAFCDVAGAWKCGDGFYCFRSDDYLGCCPTSQRCIPHTRCINGDDLESATQNDDDLKSCVDENSCGVWFVEPGCMVMELKRY
ncbi:uncharacterized protein LTHEOB_9759 [Neofusicoccum parvum]|uniref:Uncharacterized protein LTHEOB_9759 n=1 Tax=Neofusicoccum parvum TaxID=310453 RepID=A0ACB5SFB9_9PEZI|nr:uncharacterized protein LTHEOB_9759 [Neofusicoccum parvum]